MMRLTKSALLLAGVVVTVVVAWRWTAAGSAGAALPPLPTRGGGPLTVVATGDALLVRPLTSDDAREIATIVPLLGSADVALTNLEANVLAREHVPETVPEAPARWPYATADTVETLRRIGINVVSLANNHTTDYGPDGVRDTRRMLDAAGLQHAGSGDELESSRAAAFVGTPPRRVATIAVATSASPESRATAQRGDILGRPGVNPLRYSANVTVDNATFETLKGSAAAMRPANDQPADPDTLNLLGATIKRGARTVVDFAIDADDLQHILDRIRQARAEADAVIVSLHTHEPGNGSEEPADFVRRFAHAAIDAGAALVVGHGPHRLRGVEAYGHGAILYSVGNFIFQYQDVDPRAMDVYDAGVDLYRMAMGAIDFSQRRPLPTFDEPVWWEAVMARATFDRGGLTSLQLVPIDLGAEAPKARRGIPRMAAADRATAIVDRVSKLSHALGTRVAAADGIVTVDLSTAAGR
jgi:poly-gamma-glutamate capsule biosynthesis protein CapA/YwtB (metallophosphatase superfamily)